MVFFPAFYHKSKSQVSSSFDYIVSRRKATSGFSLVGRSGQSGPSGVISNENSRAPPEDIELGPHKRLHELAAYGVGPMRPMGTMGTKPCIIALRPPEPAVLYSPRQLEEVRQAR